MCQMIARRPLVLLAAGATLGVVAGIAWMQCGKWPLASARSWPLPFPDSSLHAVAAIGGESFAVATGPIDDDAEAYFAIDFLTGELQCTVLNYRTGKFDALFKANVIAALDIDKSKKPTYLLVTGQVNFRRGGATARPGHSVVYVMDGNTGNFAAYGVPWRPDLAASGRPQAGELMLLDGGKARTLAIRE